MTTIETHETSRDFDYEWTPPSDDFHPSWCSNCGDDTHFSNPVKIGLTLVEPWHADSAGLHGRPVWEPLHLELNLAQLHNRCEPVVNFCIEGSVVIDMAFRELLELRSAIDDIVLDYAKGFAGSVPGFVSSEGRNSQ